MKGGKQKSFDSVKAQIQAQLLQAKQSQHLQQVVGKLEAAQKKLTHYAAGYAPPKTSSAAGAGTATPTS